jgi:hypothetical protein
MSFDSNNNGLYMPVVPAYGGGNGYGMGAGDGGFLWLILFFALFGGGMWGNGGMNGAGGLYPWLNQSNQMNDGFMNQMLNTNLSGIQNAVNTGFASAEVAACNRATNDLQTQYTNQIAELERSFAAQTAMNQGFNGLQSQLAQCCCDNRLATCQTQNIVQNEGAATRLAIQNQTQAILDKMCQQEIDNLKAQNLALQNQVNMQNLAASQAAQTAALVADNTAQTQYIVNRVAPYPIPAYTVANPVTPAATAAA